MKLSRRRKLTRIHIYILINHYNQPQAIIEQWNTSIEMYVNKKSISLLCFCCCYNNGNDLKVSCLCVCVCSVSYIIAIITNINLLFSIFGCVRSFVDIVVCRWIMSACLRTILSAFIRTYWMCQYLQNDDDGICQFNWNFYYVHDITWNHVESYDGSGEKRVIWPNSCAFLKWLRENSLLFLLTTFNFQIFLRVYAY